MSGRTCMIRRARSARPTFALLLSIALFVFATEGFAQTSSTNTVPQLSSAMPDVGFSVLRVFGALALVIALFLGGIWLWRNWQRFMVRKNGAPKLNVLEVKSIGQRQALLVVAYEQQRMLLASSSGGVTLVSHLPAGEHEEATEAPAPRVSFAEAFQQVLSRK